MAKSNQLTPLPFERVNNVHKYSLQTETAIYTEPGQHPPDSCKSSGTITWRVKLCIKTG